MKKKKERKERISQPFQKKRPSQPPSWRKFVWEPGDLEILARKELTDEEKEILNRLKKEEEEKKGKRK